jgi:hypothetical protein
MSRSAQVPPSPAQQAEPRAAVVGYQTGKVGKPLVTINLGG